MAAQLGSSGAIDRDGSGATPDAASRFTLVPAIPRGRAELSDFDDRRVTYRGGAPRCPRCLKSSAVAFNGYRGQIKGTFHCNRCLTCWRDIGSALCYICDDPFQIPRNSGDLAAVMGHLSHEFGSCYHLNTISQPFCKRCTVIIGTDQRHRRRQLRRMVGLR